MQKRNNAKMFDPGYNEKSSRKVQRKSGEKKVMRCVFETETFLCYVTPNLSDCDTCVCINHANTEFMVKKLHVYKIISELDARRL